MVKNKIIGQVRKAIKEYDMIQEGDRIAIGVSGGKDSLTLLIALSVLQKFYPKSFTLEAITIHMGIGEMDLSSVEALCQELGVNYTVEYTLIGRIVFDERKEKNPCSMCANLRRGALNNIALRLGCNKVALAHNKDDVIETLLLGLFYEGRIHTFSPVTFLDRQQLHVIRPLINTQEKEARAFINAQGIAIVKNPCLANGNTKRQYIKQLISEIRKDKSDIKNTLFGAIKRAHLDDW